ncbi:ABC transporter substrate-binding protein [Leucobacter rhizosphaerae]|uniref:ABC transporter substrate-binding protein n=1 Tax=Leucobacter rhizosphaerae TaxID=2932245 RepID=A0ABY4FTW4_9MICO|nr:ABC transporter substrate-binding protein [Leucobacter rhizosphaerae]UOQ59697.1 ABC transporter substrate-binding protein [Leucobacter rhizosphaerae]
MKSLIPLSIAGLLLSGCSGGGSGSGGGSSSTPSSDTLRVNFGGFPETWAPGSQAMEPGYARVPYEMLVIREKDGTILPNLATAWEFGDGATSLTLTLRDDVKFHDGTDFNADAVKANFEYVANVVGGQFGGPLKAGVASVDVVDDQTVTFNFTRPFGTFLDLLSQRNLPMGSPTAIADGSIETHPVGTGPWAYDPEKSVEGTSAYFGAFADYWGEEPGFPNIDLYAIPDDTAATAALLAGDIDITDTEVAEIPRIDAASNAEWFDYPAIRNNVTFFDRGPGGVFEDQRVREALCYAVDNDVVANMATDLEAANQHFTEGEPGFSEAITGTNGDLDEALKIWEELGNPELKAEIPAAPFNLQQVTVRVEQMNQLPNVDITVQEVTPSQFFSSWNGGQYPLGVGSHGQITPADWYGGWFSAQAPVNHSGFVSEELQAAASAAQQAGGTPEAEELWQNVMYQVSEERLSCSHLVVLESIAYNTDTVANVGPGVQAWEQNLIDYRAVTPAG